MKRLSLAIATLLFVGAGGVALRAECVAMDLRSKRRQAVRILEGTVLETHGMYPEWATVTIEVHRVWQGPIAPTAIFRFVPALDSAPSMRVGDRLAFFAIRYRAEDWDPSLRVPKDRGDKLPELVLPCWGGERVTPTVIAALGEGRTLTRH